MKWFNSPRTLEELKKQYKKLAVQHHPDLGGNTQEMQEINAEYDVLFEKLKNVRTNAEGKTYTAKEPTTETPDEYKDIIGYLRKGYSIRVTAKLTEKSVSTVQRVKKDFQL